MPSSLQTECRSFDTCEAGHQGQGDAGGVFLGWFGHTSVGGMSKDGYTCTYIVVISKEDGCGKRSVVSS